MIMKPYSEVLKKYFDTVENCEAAEAEYQKKHEALQKKNEEKKAEAQSLEEKRKKVQDAYAVADQLAKEWREELAAFNKKYNEPLRTQFAIRDLDSILDSWTNWFFRI